MFGRVRTEPMICGGKVYPQALNTIGGARLAAFECECASKNRLGRVDKIWAGLESVGRFIIYQTIGEQVCD